MKSIKSVCGFLGGIIFAVLGFVYITSPYCIISFIASIFSFAIAFAWSSEELSKTHYISSIVVFFVLLLVAIVITIASISISDSLNEFEALAYIGLGIGMIVLMVGKLKGAISGYKEMYGSGKDTTKEQDKEQNSEQDNDS